MHNISDLVFLCNRRRLHLLFDLTRLLNRVFTISRYIDNGRACMFVTALLHRFLNLCFFGTSFNFERFLSRNVMLMGVRSWYKSALTLESN